MLQFIRRSLRRSSDQREEQQDGMAVAATTARLLRSDFARSATGSLFLNIWFTNHESLPSLPDAMRSFVGAFPQYGETRQADEIREEEYTHLDSCACFDYAGIGLFSRAQFVSEVAAAAAFPPFFTIAYKCTSLTAQLRHGDRNGELENGMKRRILRLLKMSDGEYYMVCTANRTGAFRLLAEAYPFQTHKNLLTVYDYDSEAVTAMADSARNRGASVASAKFTWPRLRIHTAGLVKELTRRRRNSSPGLFVFPLQSRTTGTRYAFRWMSTAREHGWHVVLDACAMGSQDLDAFGLSVILPDFIICNFFKVFGENPSGFAALFVRKSSMAVLQSTTMTRSIGIVSIVPMHMSSRSQLDDCSSRELQAQVDDDELETASSFSGPIAAARSGEFSRPAAGMLGEASSEIVELTTASMEMKQVSSSPAMEADVVECRGLDHAECLGLQLIGYRLRCITNWLVVALLKLQHPDSSGNGRRRSLVRIYGHRVKFERGPALAFNVFDWKGDKVDPLVVQKLADRNNVSLTCCFLQNILFPATAAERREEAGGIARVNCVHARLGFLNNFEDAYKLWAFVAKFLDADFVEKEKWRYMALNQKIIEI